jgi:CelD/BcsL family acetyltransferase involved in cellulose biosynthesis
VAARSDLVVEVAATPQAIDALAQEWAALEAATPEATGFQSHDWCRAWIVAAAARDAPALFRVVCLREQGRLVMLWPLQIDSLFGVRILRWLGEPMTQYGDALALPGEGRARWREAVEAELARWRDVDLFALTRLRTDGVLAAAGLSSTPYGEALAAPFVDFRASSIPRTRKKSLARRAKRLSGFGKQRLLQAGTPSVRRELILNALALKRDWLRAKGFVSTGLSSPVTAAFLDQIAKTEMLRIHTLMVGAEVAAIEIGFVAGDAYRSLLGCYDARFSEGAPGHALSERLLEHYSREGVATFDFLAPADAYKRIFARGETPLFAHFSARSLLGGAAAFALKWLRPAAKRLLAKRAQGRKPTAHPERAAPPLFGKVQRDATNGCAPREPSTTTRVPTGVF